MAKSHGFQTFGCEFVSDFFPICEKKMLKNIPHCDFDQVVWNATLLLFHHQMDLFEFDDSEC